MTPVIEVRDLRYRYEDGTEALKGVNFCLQAGESVALFGANGSGKSTFAQHLIGLLTGQGSITVCGIPVTRQNAAAVRRKVGLVFQDSETQLFMPTVLEDVAFGLLNQGMQPDEARKRAGVALERAGMSGASDKAPYHLSAGEKKRVAIAGILALEPEVLVLDEPTTFLDPPGQRALADLLRNLPQAKILITHDTQFALATCTRGVFFRDGAIAGEDSVGNIADRFGWVVRNADERRY
jgi:cobalt/nickel transport system ATP-binding protein